MANNKYAEELGLRIIIYMRNRIDEAIKKYELNFYLVKIPVAGLSLRFIDIDKSLYG